MTKSQTQKLPHAPAALDVPLKDGGSIMPARPACCPVCGTLDNLQPDREPEDRRHCVIAVDTNRNSWGRGQTINDALTQLVKAGGKRGKHVQLRFIAGDHAPFLDDMGSLRLNRSAIAYKI